MSIATIPAEQILITGAAGFIGTGLAEALLASSPTLHLTLTDVQAPAIPSSSALGLDVTGRVTTVQCDLTDPTAVAALLAPRFSAVYLLHGLMSGGAEASLELGWRINWDSHRGIIDHLRQNRPGTVVVFPSSLAVYGPSMAGSQTSEATCPLPQSSYGTQKLMVESYLYDFSRRGLLDARIARLPTVIVRPGAPSAAASSFASGMVREPLRGQEAVLPVARNLALWVCSPATVVANLVKLKDVPAARFAGLGSRVVNLPGITVTVQEILDALEAVGGATARARVKEARDDQIEAIVASWPARFDISRAMDLGMQPDGTLEQTVQAFARTR